MNIKDFDYHLPEVLIAQRPAEKRDHSRLMVVDRKSGNISHDYFYNLDKYLDANDLLVFNNTKVIPVRIRGKKLSGGKVEVLLHKYLPGINSWEAIYRGLGRAREIIFDSGLVGKISDDLTITFNLEYQELLRKLDEIGEMPLPPYIGDKGHVDSELQKRYQTVYAKEAGSAAAPTAGLHFTEELMAKFKIAEVTLQVGLGTFAPLKSEVVEENKLHEESFVISEETLNAIEKQKKQGSLVAVGTTTVRVLETYANEGKTHGETSIFIYPGYEFKMVDKLITNFHLPKSSLLMLVCAFGGKDLILRAYEEAVREKYRFFSFGDAMLVI